MLYGESTQTGIVHETMTHIFEVVSEEYDKQYSVEMSFIELHNNSFRNLLKPHILEKCTKRLTNKPTYHNSFFTYLYAG